MSLANNTTNTKEWVENDVKYALDKIHQVDSIINGLKDVLDEHKNATEDSYDTDIEKLCELHQQMIDIVTDIYKNEGGIY